MISIHKLRIKPLLIFFTAGLTLLLLLQSGLLFQRLHLLTTYSHYEHTVTDKLVAASNDIRYSIVQIQQYQTDSAATGENDGLNEAQKSLLAGVTALDQVEKLAPADYAQDIQQLRNSLQQLHQTGLRMVAAYLQSREAGNAIMKAPDGFDRQSSQAQSHIEKLVKRINTLQQNTGDQVTQLIDSLYTITLALSGMMILLSIIGGYGQYQIFMRMLGGEPAEGKILAQKLADGELTSSIELRSGDKDSLIASMDRMRARWVDIIMGLRGHAEMMGDAAANITQQSHGLAGSSSQQSISVTAIAEGIEALSASINLISSQASAAWQKVVHSGEAAMNTTAVLDRATTEVQQVANTVTLSARHIDELQVNMNEINSIVAIIREIADQTNLLALNAAIEAARAGEYGRGFAVVADEVRKLAERTSGSTRSISAMISQINNKTSDIVATIQSSVDQVGSGVLQINTAQQKMQEVLEASIHASKEMVIIHASLESATSSAQQIASEVTSIATSSEANSQSARTLSDASIDLHKIAEALRADSCQFKYESGEDGDNSVTLF